MKCAIVIAFFTLTIVPQSCLATIVIYKRLPTLIQESVVVCRGEVLKVEPDHIQFRIDFVYKGKSNPVTRIIKQDHHSFSQGEYNLLFLKIENEQFAISDWPIERRLISRLPVPAEPPYDPMSQLKTDLVASLSDLDPIVIATAIRLLGEMGESDIASRLKESLIHEDSRIRGEIYFALLGFKDYSHFEETIAYINGPDPLLEYEIIHAIGKIHDIKQLPKLNQLTKSSDSSLRGSAVRAIREIHHHSSVPYMIPLLDDPDSHIRYGALMALAEITERMNGEWATSSDYFKANESKYTSKWKEWWAAQGRLQYGSEEGQRKLDEKQRKKMATLHELTKSKDRVMRDRVTLAIRDEGRTESIPYLIPLLDDPYEEAQYGAIKALASILDKKEAEWYPKPEAFHQNPSEYVNRWKEWYIKEGQYLYTNQPE